eukprot:scaffold264651_cov17-Tisochrysis_lutea.AAC.1
MLLAWQRGPCIDDKAGTVRYAGDHLNDLRQLRPTNTHPQGGPTFGASSTFSPSSSRMSLR